MGWALFACFGCTKKRKRPKTASKFGSKSRRRIRGYELIKLQNPKELDVSQDSLPLSSPREKPKDETKARIKKKVRFNLEVVTYEPLNSQDDVHDNIWEERGGEESDQAAAVEACLVYAPLSKTDSTDTKLLSHPSNYRYSCYYDGEDEYEYDEEDSNECQISDDEDDEEGDDDSGMVNTQNIYFERIAEELRDCTSVPLISSATNARLRSHYLVPVLNPIENISQWKTVKTRKC